MTPVAGDASPDRKQAGSLFYIGLGPSGDVPKSAQRIALGTWREGTTIEEAD
jgi:hypothetical protein